ncbi:MAG: CPBP family intramembrane metalloprotease [Gloeobacteraceae cyanobacterium ES-bin-316]|nr:CPBP family intramembrane metalloprotease [Ferruginibacter sp.]
MQYKSIKGFTGWGQVGILLVFLGLGFILAGGFQIAIGMQMIPDGTPADKMPDAMLKALLAPANVGLARLSQVLGTFFLLFTPAVLYSLVVNGKNKFWLGFNPWFNGWQILVGFFIILFANLLASPLADLTKFVLSNFPSFNAYAQNLEDLYNEQVLALSNLKSWGEFILAVFIMAFFPALFEELFFRGAMQNLFVKWWKKPLLAIMVTSLIFSLIHYSVYLFLSRAVLGFVLGLLYYKTKNIWVNIVAHFLNNTIAVAQLFYLSGRKEKLAVDKLDPEVPWWLGLVSLVVVYFLFWLLQKISEQYKARILAREQVLVAEADPFHSFASDIKV